MEPLDQNYLRINYHEAGFGYLLPEILTLFHGQATIYLHAIEQHLLQGNVPALVSEAHALKGAAGSVGAAALAQVAEQLEDNASPGDLALLASLVDQLRRATALTDVAIVAELEQLATEDDKKLNLL